MLDTLWHSLTWVDAFGFAGALVSIYAYLSKTMIRLRLAAIIGNALFLTYAAHKGILPNALLNCVLMVLNMTRLFGMFRQIDAMKEATRTKFNIDWLRPYMSVRDVAAGSALFAKGDVAEEAYCVEEGEVLLPELAKHIGPGELFGEMGMISTGNRRSTSAVAATPLKLLVIDYREFKQLVLQNPEFGFYLMRLVMQRMEANAASPPVEKRPETLAVSP